MHTIEPYYNWRDFYIASEDELSPFYQREYSEFTYSQKIYNYFIHPQWDGFGSNTLYLKILYTDYARQFAIIELIGEWNDCIHNDVMYLKRNIIDVLLEKGIAKFILIGENVLNFHAADDCYYEEWYEDAKEQEGWIAIINFREHILEEMSAVGLFYYLHFGEAFNNVRWRNLKPLHFFQKIEYLLEDVKFET